MQQEENTDLDLFGNAPPSYAPEPSSEEERSPLTLPEELVRSTSLIKQYDITVEWVFSLPDEGDSTFDDLSLADIEQHVIRYLKEFIPDLALADYGFNMVSDRKRIHGQGEYHVIAWKKTQVMFTKMDIFEIDAHEDSWNLDLYDDGYTGQRDREWSLETSLEIAASDHREVHIDLSHGDEFNLCRQVLLVRRDEILASDAIWRTDIEPLSWSNDYIQSLQETDNDK